MEKELVLKPEKEMEMQLLPENRIKKSARDVFRRKGYNGARVTEIADNAGINRAMIHYYFRSKKSLFDIIMQESVIELADIIRPSINNKNTDISEKIDLLVANYSVFLAENKDFPLFIMGEMQTNPDRTLELYFSSLEGAISDSVFFSQLEEYIAKRKLTDTISAYHVIINIVSLCIFPFLSDKLLKKVMNLDDVLLYDLLIEERKELNSLWIKKMLNLE